VSILILSRDEFVGESLVTVLERAGVEASFADAVPVEIGGPRAPLVVLADGEEGAFQAWVKDLLAAAPWTRAYQLWDGRAPALGAAPLLVKPFDALEIGSLLVRDHELAALDRSRRGLEKALEHGERLATLGRLAAIIAHDIANPLTVLDAGLATLRRGAADGTERDEILSDMTLAVERISAFVGHVAAFARREAPALVDLPLAETVSMAARLVSARAAKKEVRLSIEPIGTTRLPQDPPRLAQALMNLFANAIDAAASGGRTVTVRSRHEGDGADARVAIEIADDGPGLAPEIAARLFEPFVTSKPAGEGTGLGLSIAKAVVDGHGGTIAFEPGVPEGTRVVVLLPLPDVSRSPVLVVVADAAVRRAMCTDLGRAGFRVVAAQDAAEALSALAAEAPRVVVTDQRLGDGSGLELLEQVKSAAPAVGRVVLATAVWRAPRNGVAERVVPKPWKAEDLQGVVRELYLRR
jgi:signal transduction histidine kinase